MMEDPSNPSFGYGGKFGIEKDRMDQSAVGHEYIAKIEKHASQKDYSTGFGGKFGIQTDRVDKVSTNSPKSVVLIKFEDETCHQSFYLKDKTIYAQILKNMT
jgi:uncharacterized protein (DUF1330 family)